MDKGQLLIGYASKVFEDANSDGQKMLEVIAQHYNDGTLEAELKHFAEVSAQKAETLIGSAENDKRARVEQLEKEKAAFENLASELDSAK